MAPVAKPFNVYTGPMLPNGPIPVGPLPQIAIDTGNAAVIVLECRGASGVLNLAHSVAATGQGAANTSWEPLVYSSTPDGLNPQTGPINFIEGTRIYAFSPISAILVQGSVASASSGWVAVGSPSVVTSANPVPVGSNSTPGLSLWCLLSPFPNSGGPVAVDLTADFAALTAALAALNTGLQQVQLLDEELNPINALNPLPVNADGLSLGESENHIGKVGGIVREVAATAPIIRPANSTAYAAGQQVANSTSVVGQNLNFPNCARLPGGSGWIVGAILTSNAAPATKAQLDLYLNSIGFAMVVDGTAAAPTPSQLANAKPVSFTTSFAFNADTLYFWSGPAIPFRCLPGQTNLLGMAVMRNAYTPASGEILTFTLIVVPD